MRRVSGGVPPGVRPVSQPPARARVLFVDDDRLQREMAQDALGDRLDLECLASAEEAVASLARERNGRIAS